jgi:hypothetical protein
MAQPVQFPPPSCKLYPVVYVTNGQAFPGTDLAKLCTRECMTDGFIERGIRAVAHMPDDEEGIALTVGAAWDWPGSKVKCTIAQRSVHNLLSLLQIYPSLTTIVVQVDCDRSCWNGLDRSKVRLALHSGCAILWRDYPQLPGGLSSPARHSFSTSGGG